MLATRFVGDAPELRVAFGGGDIVTWRASDGALVGYLRGACEPTERRAWTRAHAWDRELTRDERAAACAVAEQAHFTADGRLIATAGRDGVRIRDAETGRSLGYDAESAAYDNFAFHRDGQLFHGPISSGERAAWWSADRGWRRMFVLPDELGGATPRLFADKLEIELDEGVVRWNLETREGRIVRTPSGDRSEWHEQLRIGGRVRAIEDTSAHRLEVRRTDRADTVLATAVPLPSGGFIATTPVGAVDGTADAFDHLLVVVEGVDPTFAIPPHEVWDELHAPGLLRDALAGRAAPARPAQRVSM